MRHEEAGEERIARRRWCPRRRPPVPPLRARARPSRSRPRRRRPRASSPPDAHGRGASRGRRPRGRPTRSPLSSTTSAPSRKSRWKSATPSWSCRSVHTGTPSPRASSSTGREWSARSATTTSACFAASRTASSGEMPPGPRQVRVDRQPSTGGVHEVDVLLGAVRHRPGEGRDTRRVQGRTHVLTLDVVAQHGRQRDVDAERREVERLARRRAADRAVAAARHHRVRVRRRQRVQAQQQVPRDRPAHQDAHGPIDLRRRGGRAAPGSPGRCGSR